MILILLPETFTLGLSPIEYPTKTAEYPDFDSRISSSGLWTRNERICSVKCLFFVILRICMGVSYKSSTGREELYGNRKEILPSNPRKIQVHNTQVLLYSSHVWHVSGRKSVPSKAGRTEIFNFMSRTCSYCIDHWWDCHSSPVRVHRSLSILVLVSFPTTENIPFLDILSPCEPVWWKEYVCLITVYLLS